MINILYVYGDKLRHGGMEACMMNYFRSVHSDEIHIDFAIQSMDDDAGDYADEIRNGGSNIYVLPKYHVDRKGYRSGLMKILSGNKYQIVHAHCDAMNHRVLKLAKRCGVPVRISHSHNTKHLVNSKLKYMYYEIARYLQNFYATDRWACSEEAGRWMFGRNPFTVIPNAIDVSKYRFDETVRKKLRTFYNIQEHDILIGHVGRLDYQKNHVFMLDIMANIIEAHNNIKLVCVGDGPLRSEIEAMAYKKNLTDHVIFTGQVSNAFDYYNMFDIYIQPSLFEGFGISVLEAQSNGLKCYVADNIPESVNVSGNVTYLKLDQKLWIKTLLASNHSRDEDAFECVARSEFNLSNSGRRMSQLYKALIQ